MQLSGKSDPTVPSYSTAVSTYTKDTGPPNNTILPSSFAPSSHPARQGAPPDEPTTDISQKRKPAKKQVGSKAKKTETGEAASGATTLGFPSLGRTDCVLEETTSLDALEQERTSLNDQMLKSKEKLLSTKERKLKDLEKKLHMKEINMSDQLDQNEYSKTYILTMEHKVKELENTNRLLKMKMLQQEEAGTVGNDQNGLVTEPTQSNRTRNEPQASADLHARVTQMELKFLEHRINTLEHNFQTSQNQTGCMHATGNNQSYTYPAYSSAHYPSLQPHPPMHYYSANHWHDPYYYNYQHYHSPYAYGHPPHLDPRWSMGSTNNVHPTSDFHHPRYSSAYLATTQTLQSSRSNDHSASSQKEGDTRQINQPKLGQERVSVYSRKPQDYSVEALNEQPIPVHFSYRGRRKTARLKGEEDFTPVKRPTRQDKWNQRPRQPIPRFQRTQGPQDVNHQNNLEVSRPKPKEYPNRQQDRYPSVVHFNTPVVQPVKTRTLPQEMTSEMEIPPILTLEMEEEAGLESQEIRSL